MPSSTAGSRNVALGPTRRSEVTRAPSISSSTRPRARPRMAGTAAWPSETWLMPGTVSSACSRCSGARVASCRRDRSVVAAAGEASMLGAAPRTVTDSSANASTCTVRSLSIFSMTTGLATCPPGITTTRWNGVGGAGASVNRPSTSVVIAPGRPATETVAPAMAAPDLESTTRPEKVAGWPAAAGGFRNMSAAKTTAARRTTTCKRPPPGNSEEVHFTRCTRVLPALVGRSSAYRAPHFSFWRRTSK